MNRVSKWRISRAAERITARLPAPKGANYSITASKRSAPADGCYCLYTAPRGSNEPGGWKLRMRRPRRGHANSSLGWSTAEPEVWWMERMSASKRSLCPLRQVACTPLRGYPRGVRAFRGFRCAPPAATDRSAPLGPSLRRRCCLRRGGFLAAHSSGRQPRYDILLSAWLLRARGAADASRHVGPKFRPAPRCALFGKPLKRTAWLSAF